MPLHIGTRVGPYAITARIEGGVSEVPRAGTTNLGDVAIKALAETSRS